MHGYRQTLTLLVAVSLVGWFGFVPVVMAEDTCECYCNIEGRGATQYPDADTKLTVDQCQETCQDEGYSVATCAYDANQKPQFNVMCFTPDECAAQGGILTATGTGTPTQPGECKAGMYYCYPDPSTRQEAALQVEIAGLKVTGDLGEYISYVYKWMLGVGTTIAIVFLMVSGLRWSLGGASAEQIGKAKKTILNAMIGLVLLLSTYLIVYTVNPYLVRLQVPAFPLIKTVSLVGEESCGYLKGVWGTDPYRVKYGAPYDSPYAQGGDPGKGYTLADGTDGTNCGSVVEVTKDPEGNTVADDMVCTFDYCSAGETCVTSSVGGECYSCGDVYNTSILNSTLGITANPSPIRDPSSGSCTQFKRRLTALQSASGIQTYCEFDSDLYNKCVEIVYPDSDDPSSTPGLNCNALRKTVYSSDNPCEAYEDVVIRYGDGLDGYYTKGLGNAGWLDRICTQDPCGLGGLVGKTCAYSESYTTDHFDDCDSI